MPDTELLLPLIMIIFVNVPLDKQLITNATFTALLLMGVASTTMTIPVIAPKLRRLAQAPSTRDELVAVAVDALIAAGVRGPLRDGARATRPTHRINADTFQLSTARTNDRFG